MTRLDRLFGDRRMRWGTLVALVLVVAGGLAFRLPVSLVLILLLTVLAVAVVVRLIGSAELGWPVRRDEASSQGWVGVAMLSHSLAVADSSPWEFDRVIRPRLTRLATAALSRQGVDWDTEQARQILGSEVHEALRPDSEPGPPGALPPPGAHRGTGEASRTTLAAATLDVLERLEKASAA